MYIDAADLRVARTFLPGRLHRWQTLNERIVRIGDATHWITLPCVGTITPGMRSWPRCTGETRVTIGDDVLPRECPDVQYDAPPPTDTTRTRIDSGKILSELARVCGPDSDTVAYSHVCMQQGWAYATDGRVLAMAPIAAVTKTASIPSALARAMAWARSGVLYTHADGQWYDTNRYTMYLPPLSHSLVLPDMGAYLHVPPEPATWIIERPEFMAFCRVLAKGDAPITLKMRRGDTTATLYNDSGDSRDILLAEPALQSVHVQARGTLWIKALQWLKGSQIAVHTDPGAPTLLHMRTLQGRYAVVSCMCVI